MTFNSLTYACFLPLVLVIYHRLGLRGQNRTIVVAGSIFYGLFDWRFLGLLYLSIIVDYLVGRGLAGTDDPRRRKQLLAVSLTTQLGILAFFKYANFFVDSAASLLGRVGLDVDPFTLGVVLPVGISFYTFQSLAYVFAVYRRQLDAERDLTTFAAFIAWFPQLVAGPIERAQSLLPQIRRARRWPDAARVESALLLILRGLFKKVVIADSLATYVTQVYEKPYTMAWPHLVLATVGFAVQVYGDFSGYSDIARGSSRLLGVELRRNFEQPFLSRDIRELWNRWHTSLGGWFVENVVAPLGGSRKGPRRAALNVLLMFTLIGLWHGAAWTFVVWGFLNGVLVAGWRFLPTPKGRHPMKLKWREAPAIAFTFALFCGGVVFFRSSTIDAALHVGTGILKLRDGEVPPTSWVLVPVMLALVVLIDLNERRRRIAAIESLRVKVQLGGVASPAEAAAETPIGGISPVAAGLVLAAAAVALVVFSGGTPKPFIYFVF